MKVLVTGAGGFIGAALVRALADAGHDPRAHLGAPGDSVTPPAPGVECFTFDIADEAALRTAMRGADAVVHLAGPAAVAPSFGDPAGYARAHVAGTASVVAAIEALGVPACVYVSSAEVYGRPDCDPVDESAPLQPRSPYGAAKAGAELVVASAVRRNGIESAVVLRPFSVYGPRQRPNSLLSSLLRQAVSEAEIVLDDLRPVRDYIFVDDVASSIVTALALRPRGTTIANVASGHGISVEDLAHTAVEVTGRGITVRQRGATRPPDAEIMRLVADVSHARRCFAWSAQTALSEGLRRTLSHAAIA